MGNFNRKENKYEKGKNKGYLKIGISLVFAVIFAGAVLFNDAQATASGDLKIPKNQITTKVKAIPYKAGKVKMEILAVKANDGSIRTVFNACQVCFDSGRGYYKQEGNELVCQNCGNRFNINNIEVVSGGCNPVPILKQNKKDDGKNIVISKKFIAKYKRLFEARNN